MKRRNIAEVRRCCNGSEIMRGRASLSSYFTRRNLKWKIKVQKPLRGMVQDRVQSLEQMFAHQQPVKVLSAQSRVTL